MERSASSSSILRTKGSDEKDDCSPRSSFSSIGVTILNVEELPIYSTERYYMLAELEQNASGTVFLSDDLLDDTATQETEDLSTESNMTTSNRSNSNGQQPQHNLQIPQFCLLYVLWRPEMPSDPKIFTETVLLDAITKLQTHADIQNSSEELKEKTGIFQSLQTRLSLRKEKKADASASEGENPDEPSSVVDRSTRVYLVVDHVDSDMNDGRMSSFFAKQETLAKTLSREVSTHPALRHTCEGLVVGISNHLRAAPGLEACMNAVSVGGPDRRRQAQSTINTKLTKSTVGLVALNPEDLMGLDAEAPTDAAQGIWQRRISAEWGGQGNLQSFATRGHQAWCLLHGLYYDDIPSASSPGSSPSRRRVARIPKQRQGANGDEQLVNFLAMAFIVGYVAFHFQEEVSSLWKMAQTYII